MQKNAFFEIFIVNLLAFLIAPGPGKDCRLMNNPRVPSGQKLLFFVFHNFLCYTLIVSEIRILSTFFFIETMRVGQSLWNDYYLTIFKNAI